jgi:hypothetical protein
MGIYLLAQHFFKFVEMANMYGMYYLVLYLFIYLFITSGPLKVEAPTIIKSRAANATKNYREDCHSSM